MSRIRLLIAALAVVLSPAVLAEPIDINRADAGAIAEALDGVGRNKAQAIVAYRDTHGPFRSLRQLARIRGIGHAIVERNRELIRLGDVSD